MQTTLILIHTVLMILCLLGAVDAAYKAAQYLSPVVKARFKSKKRPDVQRSKTLETKLFEDTGPVPLTTEQLREAVRSFDHDEVIDTLYETELIRLFVIFTGRGVSIIDT